MSTFEVKVRSIEVSEHPNADLLGIGRVDGYQFIVAKGQFRTGDLGVYILEQVIVPEPLIKEMGLEARPGYQAFDHYTAEGFYSYYEFLKICAGYSIEPVPVLYQDPFSPPVLAAHTSGKSTLANHIREGIVIRPVVEREDPELGRVILKSISSDYLTRKGEVTEFN